MNSFRNQPTLRGNDDTQKIKRYVHSALTIDHNGIKAQITENGKVVLNKVSKTDGETVEYDEIEIPASLVFKLASLLKATRQIQYVPLAEPVSHQG